MEKPTFIEPKNNNGESTAALTVFELRLIQRDIAVQYFKTPPELHEIHDENQRAEYIKWMNSGDY